MNPRVRLAWFALAALFLGTYSGSLLAEKCTNGRWDLFLVTDDPVMPVTGTLEEFPSADADSSNALRIWLYGPTDTASHDDIMLDLRIVE